MILFCNCGYSDIIDSKCKAQILNELAGADVDFEVVQDLCELAAKKDPRLKRWANKESLTIVACYPRTIKWLFHFADARLDLGKTDFINMRTCSAEQVQTSLFCRCTSLY